MDGSRFDALARSLAAPRSRRGLLGGLAALAAGLAGARVAEAQVSQAQCGNTACKNNPGRCNPGCVCCVWGNGNSRCRPPGNCAGGAEVCPAGQVPDPVRGCVVPATTTTAAPATTTTTAAPTTTTTTAAPTTTTTTTAAPVDCVPLLETCVPGVDVCCDVYPCSQHADCNAGTEAFCC